MELHIESTETLWHCYRETRDIGIRNELVTRYASLVHRQAARSSRHLSLQVTVDEVASAAFDGLLDAVETFDPDRGFRFETYAAKRILGAVYDWLRAVDPQSRGVRDFQKRRDAAFTLVSSDIGERASAPQIAEQMGMTPGQYETYLRRVRSGVVASLTAPDDESDRGGRANGFDLPDQRQPAPHRRTERDMIRDYIMRGLRVQERHVLLLCYYDGLTMKEAGKVMGLSESRVSQIHKNVLTALRGRFRGRRQQCALV